LGQKKTDSPRSLRHSKRPSRLGRRPAILVAAIALLALAIPAAADAKKGKGGPKITVMTRNVFLGADLTPALESGSIGEAVDAAGQIINELDSTRFQDRAVPLAREIKKSKADLVGLQEVALWRDQTPSDYTTTPATHVRYDFLDLLLNHLNGSASKRGKVAASKKKGGPKYKVVISQEEFDEELPADTDGSNATGSGPLAFAGADIDGRLTMRDVILVKKGSKVNLGATDGAQYVNQFEAEVGGVITVPVERGWVSVEAKVGGKGKGQGKGKGASASKKGGGISKFRFVNTHLEAFGEDTIREAQAKELIAGPLSTNKQVVLVGDINSGTAARHNVQGTDQLAFQALLDFGMKDNGAIHSCCYSDMFDETQVFDHTVDHVLTKPGLKSKREHVTGNDVSERTGSDLWPSDHGGVVSRLTLKK
jgi:endonuclease/exonuclease/phosphatase family metal-dependent hydrolase